MTHTGPARKVIASTEPFTDAPVIETPQRIYAPANNATGTGRVNALRAVEGTETTVVPQRGLLLGVAAGGALGIAASVSGDD